MFILRCFAPSREGMSPLTPHTEILPPPTCAYMVSEPQAPRPLGKVTTQPPKPDVTFHEVLDHALFGPELGFDALHEHFTVQTALRPDATPEDLPSGASKRMAVSTTPLRRFARHTTAAAVPSANPAVDLSVSPSDSDSDSDMSVEDQIGSVPHPTPNHDRHVLAWLTLLGT